MLAGQGRTVLISSHILSELEEVSDQIVIIERGRLVAAGSVAAVKSKARAAAVEASPDKKQRLELRFAGPDDEAVRRTLAEQAGIEDLRQEGHDSWTMTVAQDPAQQAALVKALVTAGHPLCHVAARAGNLEDAFMHLTEGRVQ